MPEVNFDQQQVGEPDPTAASQKAASLSAVPPSPPSSPPAPADAALVGAGPGDGSTDGAPAASEPTGSVQGGEEGKVGPDPAPLPPVAAPALAQKATPQPRQAPRGDEVYRPAPAENPVISALKRNGLYLSVSGEAEHIISCPWTSEHLVGEVGEAKYTEPTTDAPYGAFSCPCSHAKFRSVSALIDHLAVDRMDARGNPRISVINGEPHRIVAAAEKVLARRSDLFRSNGMIVQVRVDPVTGDVRTEALTEQSLFIYLSQEADWRKYDGRDDDWKRCDVPPRIVTTLLKTQNLTHLPVLNGLARQPFLRRGDGSLVTVPGYDEASGVFAAFDPLKYALPEPTRENALAALRRLKALLSEFEFAGDHDRSATVSAMLTASIRDYLPVAPGYNITASSPGSGKSYLASVIAPFAGPGQSRNISYPATNEEATKVVLSLAIEQPAVVLFDDMPGDWMPWGAMNRMLTNGSITERVLGASRVITARASSFVMGTGNNIRPLRDMARRVASIYLLPKVETAATREFLNRPDEDVRRNRERYVIDALTIITAFDAGGRRVANVPNVAGFEEWSEMCRHSLIWLGEPDPATSFIEQITHDPDAEQLGDLLEAWNSAFGERATLVRQVIAHIDQYKEGDLRDAVMELPCVERGFVNQSRFGKYLGRNRNRIVGGFQLVDAPSSERKAWAVKRIGKPTEPPPPSIFERDAAEPERAWMNNDLAA